MAGRLSKFTVNRRAQNTVKRRRSAAAREGVAWPSGVVVTCEHGGHRIPARYQALFAPHADLLTSHRGHDPGALVLARAIARRLECELIYSEISRLLVELNRSLRHPALFSVISRDLPQKKRNQVLERYYFPYRRRVEMAVETLLAKGATSTRGSGRGSGPILHLSVHTFTPILDGKPRLTDIGLLYDPQRAEERGFCDALVRGLKKIRPDDLRIRRNYPYKGASDGLTTSLRRRFAETDYLGIELEVSQAFPLGLAHAWARLRRDIARALFSALHSPRLRATEER